MKISRILLLFIIPLFLFSYEIKFTKKFEKEVTPENIYLDIRMEYKYDNELIVNKTLSRLIKIIETDNSIKSEQKSYSVRKNYLYNKDGRKDDGYIGEASYKVWSDDYESVDDLVEDLFNAKTDEAISILTSNLVWDIDENQKNLIYDDIRDQAQGWGIEYIHSLEKKFSSECKFVSMVENGLQDTNGYYPRSESVRMLKTAQNDSLPIPKKKSIDFDTTYIFHFECNK